MGHPVSTAAPAAVLLTACGLMLATPALLAADTAEVAPIRVEALRAADASAVPNTVTILDREDLETQAAVTDDLSAILGNLVPGFAPSRQKMTSYGESLRGRSPLYLIDGVPQSNPLRDGSRDAHTIDPDLLQRVEVVNGSNAVQGLGAAGGIINLQTWNAAQSTDWSHTIKTRVSIDDGLHDEGLGYKGVYIGGRRWEKTDLTVGATYYSRGLYYDADGDPIGVDNTQGDLADSESHDLFLKTGYNLSPEQRLQFMVNRYRLKGNGDYALISGDRSTGTPASAEKGEQEGFPAENDVTTASLDYSHAALAGGQLRAQLFYQDFAAMYGGGYFASFQDPAIAPAGTLYDQSQNQSEKHGLKLTYGHDQVGIPGLSVTGGAAYLADTTRQVLAQTDREWVPESTFQSLSPFVQINQALLDGRLQLSGGLRHEMVRLEVDDYTIIASAGGTDIAGGEPEFDETLHNLGTVFHLGDSWSLYASYSEGFTMPDVGRVLRAPGAATSVDDFLTLEPVISDNREIGVDYGDGLWTLHAAYFWSDSDLGSRLENVGGVYEVRREKTEIEGLEVSLARQLTDSVKAGALYSQVRGRYDSDGDDNVDTDLDGINVSPDRLNLFLAWDEYGMAPFSGRLQLSHFMDRDFEGLNAPVGQDFEGYTLVDLTIGKRTRVGDFQFGIENLLDEQYITYYSQTGTNLDDRYFAGRGRTLTASYQTQF
ncbi:MAG: TonB-dependent receptor [Chromatiales bacterium]|nr:TonB-dependent receptor [Chromatiales bacterium]